MKTALVRLVYLVWLFATASADFTLGSFPDVVSERQEYTLNWTAQGNYTYTIWLILNDDPDNVYEWSKADSLAMGLHFPTFDGHFRWTVPTNLSHTSAYGLWVNAFTIPFDGVSFSGRTNYFAVTNRTVAPAISSSPAATGSATSTPSSTLVPSSGGQKGLSGGAIAGAVIGSLLAIATIAIGVIYLMRRKRRETVADREAAARADRLAPVMEQQWPGYEMKTRNSRG